MNSSFAKRRISFWLLAGLLYLVCAVFAWGLHYKLSLYQHADGSTDVPAAKLLTGSDKSSLQQTVAHEAQNPFTGQPKVLVLSLLLLLSLKFSVIYRASLDTLIKEIIPLSGKLSPRHPFFFRPPPILI